MAILNFNIRVVYNSTHVAQSEERADESVDRLRLTNRRKADTPRQGVELETVIGLDLENGELFNSIYFGFRMRKQ